MNANWMRAIGILILCTPLWVACEKQDQQPCHVIGVLKHGNVAVYQCAEPITGGNASPR